jgi:hypothetical protein
MVSSKRARFVSTAKGTYPLREFLVHQGQAYRILGRVHEIFELAELAKNLKRSGKVLKSCAGVAVFHAPNRIDGGADTLSQGFLGQMSAAAGQGYALPDPVQGSFNRKWKRTAFHDLSPILECLIPIDAQIWLIIQK